MGQLTKGIFEARGVEKPFGISSPRYCASTSRLCKNSSWYNRRGEYLGWGDLSERDLGRIVREIEEGEMFIILGESEIIRAPGRYSELGLDYVVDNCRYVVVQGHAFLVTDEDEPRFMPQDYYAGSTEIKVLTRDQGKALIASGRPVF